MIIYVGDEPARDKFVDENAVYASALSAVFHRVNLFYQYLGDGSLEHAVEILASENETAAHEFLMSRSSQVGEGITPHFINTQNPARSP